MGEAEEQGPAMRALGSLLKLTEVFLWDDGSTETKERSFFLGRTKPAHDGGEDDSIGVTSECETLPEDMELTRQMNALGLPVSFRTNKETKKRMTRGKRKGMRLKHPDTSVGEALDSSKVSVGEIVSPIIFDDNPSSSLSCMSMMGQSESSSSDVAADATKLLCPYGEGENPASSTEITSDSVKEQNHAEILGIVSNDGQDCNSLHHGAVLADAMRVSASSTGSSAVLYPGSCSADAVVGHGKTEPDERLMENAHLKCSIIAFHEAEHTKTCEDHVPEKQCASESVSYSMCPEVLDHDEIDGQESVDFGDWVVYWDSYYMRNYFYNIRTHTSTWYPPVGMEHLENVDTTYKSNEVVAKVSRMDGTTDFKATDLCGLSKIDSFEPINDDVLHSQPYDELSRGVELTVVNSVADTTMSTGSVSICPELSDELNQSNNRCSDGNASCLSSDFQEHIASCRNKPMQLDVDEVCNSDLQPIFAGEADEPTTFDVYDKPNKVYSCEEIPKDCQDDEGIQTLDGSSMSNSCTEEVEDRNMHSETGVPAINELEMKSDPVAVKRKKKARRIRSQRKLFIKNEEVLFEGLMKECSADIGKYWCQRYLLFSRYDDGIKMDREGWYSVTPEALARHHAERCGSGSIIDCFTGVGGNAIQFAQINKHVTAIDIDPTKIDHAQHNAAIYGVAERIDFILGDFFHLAPRLKADTVFLSPPWGGPDYAREKIYDIMTMLKPHDGYFLFNTAKQVASRIVMFLPKNVDINQLAELSLSGTLPWSLEVEKNFVNGKLKGLTAYFSDTASRE